MEDIHAILEQVYERKIKQKYDQIIIFLGDEGVGKSTLMLECVVRWKHITGQLDGEVDNEVIEDILDQIVFKGRNEFADAMANSPPRSAVPVMDAARVLYKKDAMNPEQKELEKSLLDSRIRENLTMLGFQDWAIVPTMLQERRAKMVFKIPSRGRVIAYNRTAMDHKVENGDWPDKDSANVIVDRFPNLEGTDLWRRFEERDREMKKERIQQSKDKDADEIKNEEQVKTVLRAVRPWDDEAGMTYREAAKLIDYSRGWVSDRMQDWDDGHYRDLLDKEERITS